MLLRRLPLESRLPLLLPLLLLLLPPPPPPPPPLLLLLLLLRLPLLLLLLGAEAVWDALLLRPRRELVCLALRNDCCSW